MKKFNSWVLFFAITIASLSSCNKKEVVQPSNNGTNNANVNSEFNITSDGTMLIFETIEDYEKIVNNLTESNEENLVTTIEKLGHKNYLSSAPMVLKNDDDSIQEMDEILAQLLNQDGAIQIEEHIYKVDLVKEKVFVISAENRESDYQDLIIGNEHNINVQTFSIDQDVIHLVNGEEELKCGGIGSGEYPCYPNIYSSQLVKTNSDGSVVRLAPFVKFFKAGIYFRLSSQYQVIRFPDVNSQSGEQVMANIDGEGFTVEMFVKGPQGWWKKRPCNSGSIGTKTPGFHYSSSVDGSKSVTVYSGTRNLNGYYLFVQGRVKYDDGTYTLASPYGGRNINSPY